MLRSVVFRALSSLGCRRPPPLLLHHKSLLMQNISSGVVFTNNDHNNNTSTSTTNINTTARRGLRTKPVRELPIPQHERRLDVVIFGKPNSGKSVLMNTLVREKVAATSRKKHTTRGEIIGVYNHRNVQLAFFDTPGFVSIKETNQSDVQTLGKMATSSLKRADVVLLVVDASSRLSDNFKDSFAEMARYAFKHAKTEVVLVLNKVDLVEPKKRLLDITYDLVSLINGVKLLPEQMQSAALDTTTFMVSALENDGVADIKNYLLTLSKPREWLVPKNKGVTMLRLKDRAREAVLEALLDNTHQEVPYISDIYCRNISDLPQISSNHKANGGQRNAQGASVSVSKPKRRFDVSIVVDSPGQQRIVVGQQGRTLLSIRQMASSILEEMFKEYTVILFLYIEIAGKEKNNDELLHPFDDGEIIVYNNEDNDDIEGDDMGDLATGGGGSGSSSSGIKRIRGVSTSEFDDINEALQNSAPKDAALEDEDEKQFQEYVKSINMEKFIKENVVVSGSLGDSDNYNNDDGDSESNKSITKQKSVEGGQSDATSSGSRATRGKIPSRSGRKQLISVQDNEQSSTPPSSKSPLSPSTTPTLSSSKATPSKSSTTTYSSEQDIDNIVSKFISSNEKERESRKISPPSTAENSPMLKKSFGSGKEHQSNSSSKSNSDSNSGSVSRDSNKNKRSSSKDRVGGGGEFPRSKSADSNRKMSNSNNSSRNSNSDSNSSRNSDTRSSSSNDSTSSGGDDNRTSNRSFSNNRGDRNGNRYKSDRNNSDRNNVNSDRKNTTSSDRNRKDSPKSSFK